MNETNTNETPAQRKLHVGSLIVGSVLAGLAAWGMKIDLVNNYSMGIKVSTELAQVMAMAAIAVLALPMAQALIGKSLKILRYGTVIAVTLTIVAALMAYAEKQGSEIMARKGAENSYVEAQQNAEAARRDIAEAKAEAAAITEQLPSAELTRLYEDAKANRDAETSDKRGGVCGKNCRKAEDDMKVYGPRAASAKAKETALARMNAAQVRLDNAQVGTKAGPTEVSMLATVIAGQIDVTPEGAARSIALFLTGLSIVMTLVMALLAEHATHLLIKGFGFEVVEMVEPVNPTVVTLKSLSTRRDETLERLLAMCLRNPDGFIITSDRNLSRQFGVANSTMNKWLQGWAKEGKITVEPITAHKKKYAAA